MHGGVGLLFHDRSSLCVQTTQGTVCVRGGVGLLFHDRSSLCVQTTQVVLHT